MEGSELRQLREERGVRAAWIAERIGLKHRQQIHKIETKKDVSVDEFVTYVKALGLKPGDLLENSSGVRADLKPIVDDLAAMRPAALARVRDLLRLVDGIAVDSAAPQPQARAANVVSFPQPEPHGEMSGDALDRVVRVLQQAGKAEPRKGARGPENEVRFYGFASAGEGVELFDDIPEEHRQIPQYYWKKGARGVLKAVGESMIDVGIFPHDILFVKPTPEPASGELVICTLNRRVYVKQLKRDAQGRPAQLVSKNAAYQPINITEGDEVEFFGVVVGRTGDL